jgi:hypothetical protein
MRASKNIITSGKGSGTGPKMERLHAERSMLYSVSIAVDPSVVDLRCITALWVSRALEESMLSCTRMIGIYSAVTN